MRYTEDVDDAYVRWVLDDAEVRAGARRQLRFFIPILIAALMVAAISTISFAARAPDAPASVPVDHTIMLG